MKKRGFSMLLAILILAAQIPFAFAVTASGTCGGNLTWTLDDSGTLIISGTGAMDSDGGPWTAYRDDIRTVRIDDGVTSIGDSAFQECTNLANITIPNSVTSIEGGAFAWCHSLIDITIPDSVTSIGDAAFNGCDSLTIVTIPNNVTTIGNWTFLDCESLISVTIPNGVTSIGGHAFDGCQSLTNITIPDSVTSIGELAFLACTQLNNISIPSDIIFIGSNPFVGTKITNIRISENNPAYSSIDGILFNKNHTKLIAYPNERDAVSYVIPSSVTSIGDYAFQFCHNIEDITMPDSVVSIGYSAFAFCWNLMNITIPSGVTNIGVTAFQACTNLANITIPNGIVTIEQGTFAECSNLTNLTIPSSVTNIGAGAFRSCKNLKNVYYSGSQRQWESIYFEPDNSEPLIYGDDSNDVLKKAIIHYNSPLPTRESMTPTPSVDGDISKYSYAFDNSAKSFNYPAAYRFPLERFQLVYGIDFAKKMKEIDFGNGAYWSGNCYGIATTAAMLTRAGSGVIPSNFRNGATRPGELQVSDTNSEWGLTLTQFIEAMQISQYSATFAATRKQNQNQTSSLLSAMSALEQGGLGPLVICVYGKDKNGVYCGHALLAYHLDGQRLYVYDCNHPNDGARYITFSGNSWSYPIFDGVTWSDVNGEITYIQYEMYLMDWLNKGHLLGDPEQLQQVMLFINAADAVISDSYGNEIATFRKGRMVSGIDEAFPIPPLGVTADGASAARPQIAVWLPYTNEYKVTTAENATVSTVNVSKGVSVNSVAGGQTVSVPLASTFGDVSPEQYFYVPVQWAVGRGITNGTTATTFSPHKTCTRNHILTFLWRAKGSPAVTVRNPFSDVDVSGDFGKAALWAYEKGLVSGKKFNGGTPCSRADVVTYLWKLAGRPSARRSAFTDVPSNADYARAVSWAVECGVTNGTSETTFNPSGICTRAQIVTFLYRAYAES